MPSVADHMQSQSDLVRHLVAHGVVKSQLVEAAMRAVDRKYFLNRVYLDSLAHTYEDRPLPISDVSR